MCFLYDTLFTLERSSSAIDVSNQYVFEFEHLLKLKVSAILAKLLSIGDYILIKIKTDKTVYYTGLIKIIKENEIQVYILDPNFNSIDNVDIIKVL